MSPGYVICELTWMTTSGENDERSMSGDISWGLERTAYSAFAHERSVVRCRDGRVLRIGKISPTPLPDWEEKSRDVQGMMG